MNLALYFALGMTMIQQQTFTLPDYQARQQFLCDAGCMNRESKMPLVTECHTAVDGCNTECCTTGDFGSRCSVTLGMCPSTLEVEEWNRKLAVPEPIDVPAVESGDSYTPINYPCTIASTSDKPDPTFCEYGPIHTCADKSRILMHDEQEPPKTKYWCHRSQP